MKKSMALILALLVSGCATVREHKTEIVTVGVAVALAVAVNSLERGPPHRVYQPGPNCHDNPKSCQ
jgi:uncharacterized protein YsxB (DUF464 family)